MAPCNRDIYKRGKVVAVSLFGKDITEFVVNKIAAMGYSIDWHFHRNRIMVKTLDDIGIVGRLWWDTIVENKLDAHWKSQ